MAAAIRLSQQHSCSFDDLIPSASNLSGTVRPSALAVVRLMMRSNLVGCSTGRSAGFAPRRILSTKLAARPTCAASLAHRTSYLLLRRIRALRASWHVRRERQRIDANAIDQCDRSGRDVERLRLALERLESRVDVFTAPHFERGDLNAEPDSRLAKLARDQLHKGIIGIG